MMAIILQYTSTSNQHWGGVEGWGGKAYNCNWVTIKIKKKEKENVKDCIYFLSLNFTKINYIKQLW